jgi:hypothetical protein
LRTRNQGLKTRSTIWQHEGLDPSQILKETS